MLSPSKYNSLKSNILFVTNLMIISSLVNHFLVDEKLYDKNWLYSSFGILISYFIYILFIEELVNIKDEDYPIKRMKKDAYRLFVVFTISHLIRNYLIDNSITISILWLVQTSVTIFFYVYLDYISCDFVLKLNNYQNLFLDIIKIFTAEILATLITFQHLELIDISDLIGYSISYITWTLFIKHFIK